MAIFFVSAIFLSAVVVAPDAKETAVQIFEKQTEFHPQGKIDELVIGRLQKLGIQPANLSSDAVFLRRVFLDVLGTLPTAKEARTFLLDKAPNKRSLLIDQLLEREEFADYWAMKWSDALRVKAEFPINLWPNAAQAYHRWIRTSIKKNLPYDRFVRELLTANGSNFRDPQVNFYRAVQNKEPPGLAQAVALTFMGTRAQGWPKDRLSGMAAFFAQISYKSTAEWKEEIVYFDPDKAPALTAEKAAPAAVFPDGTPAQIAPGQDPREVFANWLISPKNPWFARSIVNRVWAWLLGRGIIHEADDIRADNPPSNPELLAYLEQELIGAKYDLKHVYRLILNSSAYQLSSIPRSDNPEAAVNFARYPLRQMEAEVLIDALNQITGTTEQYSSAIPEPFTFIPEGQRSIALPDGSISSPFLEKFGRPSRDTGLESERSNRPTADQRLHLLNSSHIQRKLAGSPRFQALLQSAPAGPGKPNDANKPNQTTKPNLGTKPNQANKADSTTKPNQAGNVDKPNRPKNPNTANPPATANPSPNPNKPARAGNPRPPNEIVTTLYLTILSRFPTQEELKTATEHVKATSSRSTGTLDVAWALINSAEFLYRH